MKPIVETSQQARPTAGTEAPPVRMEDPMERWTRLGIRISLWTLFIFIVFAVMFSHSFTRTAGLQSVEALDNAQLAFNLAEGKGFVTNVIRPLSLMFAEGVQTHPDGVNPPFYPLILSIAFRLKGAFDQTVVLISALFYFLLLPLVYLLGKRLFDARVGNWALLFCVLHVPLLLSSVLGVAVPLATFLITVLALVLVSAPTSRAQGAAEGSAESAGVSPLLAGAAGLVLGLGALTQYSLGLLVLPVGIYLAQVGGVRRKAVLAAFLVTFFVVIAPWLYRNYRVFHSPFFCLRNYEFMMGTTAYPGEVLYRRLEGDLYTPFQFLTHWRGAPAGIGKKYVLGVAALYEQLPSLFNVLLMGFFLVSLFYPFQNRVTRRMRAAVVTMFLVLLIVVPFFDASGGTKAAKALLPLIPLAMVFAAAGFIRLLDEWLKQPFARVVACAVTSAIIALPLVTTLIVRKPPPDNPSLTLMESFRSHMGKEAVVVTNTPWEVAWISRKKAVLFPETAQALDAIEQLVQPSQIDYIYLSPRIRSYANFGGNLWRALYLTPQPFGLFEVDPVTDSRWEILYRRIPQGGSQ